MLHRGSATQVIDLQKRTVIPGLNDSHLHLIRGGLIQPGAALGRRALPGRRLAHAQEPGRTHAQPPVVRVVGGWNEFQFAEKRMPTLEELNKAAPDTPVFVLHLYDRALLNRAALRAVGLHQGHAQPARRRDRPRQQRRTHRHADRPAQRDDSLRHSRPRDRSCRWSTRSTPPASSCANSTASA